MQDVLTLIADLPLGISTHSEAVISVYLLAHELCDARHEIASISYYATAIKHTQSNLILILENLEQAKAKYRTGKATEK